MAAAIRDSVGKTLFAHKTVVLKMKVVVSPSICIFDQPNYALKESAAGRRRCDQGSNAILDLEELHKT